jgi:quinolinate synthase
MIYNLSTTETQSFKNTIGFMRPDYDDVVLGEIIPIVAEIRALKKEKNAVILSHYYMPSELQILHKDGGVADFVGDSLGLSVEATKVKADYIIFCGVKFMAETAYILNPEKKVLLPSFEAGCSLASSINGEDVKKLKEHYPGVPVVAYVNTYAETKAESDICCTSRNALKIAKSFGKDRLIFIPDIFMGRNLQKKIKAETGKDLILWNGKCEVHEKFTIDRMREFRKIHPDAEILVHWEVPDDAVSESLSEGIGIVGSTSDIIKYVGESKAEKFILGSECDLGATLKGMYHNKQIMTPCIQCPHMKQITIYNTLSALRSIGTEKEKDYEIVVSEDIRKRAYIPIKRMIDLS